MSELVRFWKETSWWQKLLIASLIFLPYKFYDMTRPVPNYNNVTDTILYTASSVVPPTFISFSWILLTWLLTSLTVISFFLTAGGGLLEEWKVKKFVKGWVEERRKGGSESIPKTGGWDFSSSFVKWNITHEGRSPDRWVCGITFYDESMGGVERYWKFYVLPYKLQIINDSEVFHPVNDVDACWRCGGRDYNVKVLPSLETIEKRKAREAEGIRVYAGTGR